MHSFANSWHFFAHTETNTTSKITFPLSFFLTHRQTLSVSLPISHTRTQLFSLSIPTKGINYSDAASSLFFNLTGTEISPFLRQIWFWQQQKLFIMFLCQFWVFFWGCCSAFPRLNESEEHNGAANHTSKSVLLVLVAACVTLLISSAKFGCLWANEWTNKLTNEHTYKQMSERMNKRTNEQMNKWTNEQTNKRTNGRVNHRTHLPWKCFEATKLQNFASIFLTRDFWGLVCLQTSFVAFEFEFCTLVWASNLSGVGSCGETSHCELWVRISLLVLFFP